MRAVALVLACLTCAGDAKDPEYGKAMTRFVSALPTSLSRPGLPQASAEHASAPTATWGTVQALRGLNLENEFITREEELQRLQDDLRTKLNGVQQGEGTGIGAFWAFGVTGIGISAVLLASIIQKLLLKSQQDSRRRLFDPVMSMSAMDGAELQQRDGRAGSPVMMAKDDATSEHTGYWDPLELADGQQSGVREGQILHGRVVMDKIYASPTTPSRHMAPVMQQEVEKARVEPDTTYWEDYPDSIVLGNLKDAPSVGLGVSSGLALGIGCFCVAQNNLITPMSGDGNLNPFYLGGSLLVPVSWGLHVASWIQKKNGK